jgi:hypothetical protein
MKLALLASLAGLLVAPAIAQQLVVPDVPDLMLKTRQIDSARGVQFADTEVLYLKGARQRHETLRGPAGIGPTIAIYITQCDERRRVILEPAAKTYAYMPIEDPKAYVERIRKSGQPVMALQGPPVMIIDSNDTGERRPFGSFTARHVIVTTRRTAVPGATLVEPEESVVDGWYIDVPHSHCWEGVETETMLAGPWAPPRIERRGNGRRGYPIEETHRYTMLSRTHTITRELLEVSEAPLDDALFAPPADYSPALQTPYGPDMNKPDTILNRLSWYGNQAVLTVYRWFHPATYGAGY